VRILEDVQLTCSPSAKTNRRPPNFDGKLSRLSYGAISELFHLQSRLLNPLIGAVGRRATGFELSREVAV
jgi:hypothetical protein